MPHDLEPPGASPGPSQHGDRGDGIRLLPVARHSWRIGDLARVVGGEHNGKMGRVDYIAVDAGGTTWLTVARPTGSVRAAAGDCVPI